MWKECGGGCWCVCTSKRVCAFWGQTCHSSSGPMRLMLMFYFETGSLTGLSLTQVAWPVSLRDQPVSVPTISLFYRSQLFLISGPPSCKCFDNWLTYFLWLFICLGTCWLSPDHKAKSGLEWGCTWWVSREDRGSRQRWRTCSKHMFCSLFFQGWYKWLSHKGIQWTPIINHSIPAMDSSGKESHPLHFDLVCNQADSYNLLCVMNPTGILRVINIMGKASKN